MQKNSGNLKLVGGLLAGIIIGGATVVGANQAIQAIQNTEIKVSLNGQIQTFKDETTGETQYPITYHNRTYLPLRNVAQLAGLSVNYDGNTNTAELSGNNNKCILNSPYKAGTKKEREYTTYKDEYVVSLIREHYNDNAVESKLIIEQGSSKFKKNEFSVAMNKETSEFLYEIKGDEILVTKYVPFVDVKMRPDYGYKLYRVDYKITEYYGTFSESVISIDLGDNMITRNKPSEVAINESIEILNNNKDKIKNSNEFFVTNSVHATIPAVPGAFVGELYYFGEDGTYYWGASEYYNDQELVASTGTWKIENNELILNASDMLFLKGGKLIPQSNPNGLSVNELVDYKESIVWGPSVDKHELNFVDPKDIEDLGLHRYEYIMDGKIWYSNTKFNMDDNLWIKKLKEVKEKYKFLGGYLYANEEENRDKVYINFLNVEDFSIFVTYEKEKICTINGTYKVDENNVICRLNNCMMESNKDSYNLVGSELVLEDNDLGFKVIDWKYKSDAPSSSFSHAFFVNNFVNIGDIFHLATI